MASELSFGTALKRYRRAAHVTQERLAERAGYSPNYVSMLERGVRSAQPLTVDLLADALELGDLDRAALHAAAEALPPATGWALSTAAVPLIGRGKELARVSYLLKQGEVRVLTLTGPGGVGKTALSQHVALELASVLRDGSALVDLTAVSTAADVIPAIARSLMVRDVRGESTFERLVIYLQAREMLLVLDNFERLLEAAASVADLVTRCRGIKLLVTSRIPLRLRSGQEYRLRPLTIPGPEDSHSTAALLRSPAVSLFVQRAMQVHPELEIDEPDVAVIADICRKVDGLPLAIELAAARVTHLPLVTLRDRLQFRLQVLTGGFRDLPARQQRMRDTITWSYDLLAPPEQALLNALSVFASSWSLEAAEEVCGPAKSDRHILDGLRALVESSLIIATVDEAGAARYRMLDTVHEYAVEQLAASGEMDATRRRHSEYYVHLAERAEPALQDREHRTWFPLLEREHDNVRAALSWLLDTGEAELALRLSGSIWRFWQRHGDIREGRRFLEDGLARRENLAWPIRAKALWAASWLAYHQGDFARTRALSSEYLAQARERNDVLSTRNALTGLGMAALAEEDLEEAVLRLQEALDVCESLGNIWQRATSFLNLGNATMLAGDVRRAAELFEEALTLYEDRGDDVFSARARQHLGYVSLLQGEYERAHGLFTESLQTLFNFGEKPGVADGLEAVAAARAAKGQALRAGELAAAAASLRENIGVAPLTYLRPLWYPFLVKAERETSPAYWRAAQRTGQDMSLQEAVARAVSVDG